MYVCVCNAVTDHEIAERVRAGADSFEAVSFELGVAACCGRCEDCARGVVDDTLRAMRDEAASGVVSELRRPRDLIPS